MPCAPTGLNSEVHHLLLLVSFPVRAMLPRILPEIPPLENGDRLTRHEFEHRYTAMPDVRKAELIEGIVYVASPGRITNHGRPHSQIMAWVTAYWVATPGVDMGDNSTVRLDIENEPQPDVLLRLEPKDGGQSTVGEDGYVEGAPELVIEIAASSASYDLSDKKEVYRRNGVKEYIVWQVYDRKIDWFWLNEDGQYVELEPDETGLLCSRVFPGLWLDRPAMLAGNLARVLAQLQPGLTAPDHQALVEKLRRNQQ
jgi:Uma2 family endonuclease